MSEEPAGTRRTDFGWREHAEVLREILAGKKPEELERDVVESLISHSLLSREEVKKPCPTCGTPKHDYGYWKIPAAGRLLVAALDG